MTNFQMMLVKQGNGILERWIIKRAIRRGDYRFQVNIHTGEITQLKVKMTNFETFVTWLIEGL